MKLAGLKRFVSGEQSVSSTYRAALLMTTALLSVGLPIEGASAAEIIDGGTTVNAPAPWNISEDLIIGDTENGTLNVGTGAVVTNSTSTFGILGNGTGASGTVTVSGSGAKWTGTAGISVGNQGTGTLTINNGGSVSTSNGHIASGNGSTGTVLISGTGSYLSTNILEVGRGDNSTGQLTISDEGIAFSAQGHVGRGAGSQGTVVIDGQDSSWNINNSLTLGGGLNAVASVTVSNGGLLASANLSTAASIIGAETGSMAIILVTGTGSKWTAADITAGSKGTGTLTVVNGGVVESAGVSIGDLEGSTGIVNVGAGSSLTATGQFTVGGSGNGSLNIDNGGQVTGNSANIGLLSSGGDGTVSVNGIGSSWTVTNDLNIGVSGKGTLNVTNGGVVTSDLSTIGQNDGGIGNVTVDGASLSGASSWTATLISIAPVTGTTGHLTVTNGGVVTSFTSEMAIQAGSVATADVSGTGSVWNAGAIVVGGDGSATVNVSNGGKLVSDSPGVGLGSGNSKITIEGAGSSWASTGDLITGQGQITVSGGATMNTAGSSVIGVIAGRESQVLVTGAGSSWTTGGDIFLGGLGGNTINNGSGSLIVTNGGSVNVNSGAGTVFVGVGNGLGSSLTVDGTLTGQVSVNTDGRLGGSGTIGNTTMFGTIAPGNSIGTLNVAGNLTMHAGSVYEVEANANGQADKIAATGSATINGGTVKLLAAAGTYAPSTIYTIINAGGGVSGTFDNVTSNFAFLAPTLTYDPNNVYLTLVKNATFASVGITPSQIATGGGLDTVGGGAVFNAVLALTEPDARAAFDALSGEVHASAKSILIDDSRFPREAAINRLRAAFGSVGASTSPVMAYAADGPVSAAADTDRFAVWGQGFGAWGQWKGDGNAAQLNRTTGGFIIGADGNVSDAWRLGGFTGYSTTGFDVKERRSSGGSDNYHVGLYGGTQWNALAFRSGAAYTFHDLTTNRSIAFTGFSDMAKAKYNAGTAQAFGELGYGFTAGPLALESFANLAYVNLRTDAFGESGGPAALTSASSVIDTAFTTLGLRASNSFVLGTMITTAKGSLGWRHAFGDTVPVATLAFAGGNPFNIAGVPIAKDAAVVDAGLDFHLSSSAVLGLSYGGQFGANVTDQTVRANFSAKF